MNVRLVHNFCMVVLLILISSCIREDLSDCPSSQYEVKVSVKDKNYANSNSFPQLSPVDENAPFSSFEGTVYYILSDAATGNKVKESSLSAVGGADQTYTISFNDVPDGDYTLTVWGNMTAEYPAGVLHRDGKEHTDIYMATRMLKLGRDYKTVEVPLERMKGKFLLLCNNFPSTVNRVEQTVSHVYQSVDANKNYSGSTEVDKSMTFQPVLQTFLAPTSQEGVSKLKLSFYSDAATTPFLDLPEMDLFVKRNEISAFSVDYKSGDGVLEISSFINGEWTVLHRLGIE